MVRMGLSLMKPMRIFITHMHGDHVIGILGLLQSMALLGRERPLEIYGPTGIRAFIEANTKLLNFKIPFQLKITRIKEGPVCEAEDYTVKALRSNHSVLSYAYLFEEKPRPGIFYPEKALQLGVPKGPLWGRLQRGEPVTVGNRSVTPQEVTGPPREGRRVGISGDTRPSARLARFFRGVDALVYEATFLSDRQGKARESYHSTSLEAARLASRAGVRRLYITHFSPRYRSSRPLLKEARQLFPNTFAAEDGLKVEIPYA
jgi:ribonuclease Z